MAWGLTPRRNRGLRRPPRLQGGYINMRRAILSGVAQLLFDAPLTTTLVPRSAYGSSTPTFTRATTAELTDWEGLLKPVLSGEARFHGARRVRNLATENVSTAWSAISGITITSGATDPNGGATAYRLTRTAGVAFAAQAISIAAGRAIHNTLWVRRISGTGTIRMYDGSGTDALTDINSVVTSGWQRISTGAKTVAASPDLGINFNGGTNDDVVDVWHPQAEDITGQSNTNPSEYVSVGALSSPYHGANVDGVKYFDTQNGNTVASNVVTEAQGAAISASTLKNYLREWATTNLCLRSQEFDNAAWTKLGSTITANSIVAPDGTTTADSQLETATTATHTNQVASALTVVDTSIYTFSIYMKALGRQWVYLNMFDTGSHFSWFDLTNGVTGTNDAGNTSTITALPNGWYRCTATRAVSGTGLIPQIGSTTADNNSANFLGDITKGVYTWGAQAEVEPGAYSIATSYIPTTTAAVTRNMDSLTYVGAGNFNNATGTLTCDFTPAVGSNGYQAVLSNTSATRPFSSRTTGVEVYDGTNTGYLAVAVTDGVKHKGAASWGAAGIAITFDNNTPATSSFDGSMNMTTMEIGGMNGSNQFVGNIGALKIYDKPRPVQALTA